MSTFPTLLPKTQCSPSSPLLPSRHRLGIRPWLNNRIVFGKERVQPSSFLGSASLGDKLARMIGTEQGPWRTTGLIAAASSQRSYCFGRQQGTTGDCASDGSVKLHAAASRAARAGAGERIQVLNSGGGSLAKTNGYFAAGRECCGSRGGLIVGGLLAALALLDARQLIYERLE